MTSEVIERVNKIDSAEGQPKLLTFQDRHEHEKSDPDPDFQPFDHRIEGVVDDEHIENNNDEDHEVYGSSTDRKSVDEP